VRTVRVVAADPWSGWLPGGSAVDGHHLIVLANAIRVTGVTVTDLGPGVTATRIDIAAPGSTRQVTTRLADGLAIAVITSAPLAPDDPVMDRLAEPVTGPDLLSQFRDRPQPPPLPWPRRHRRFEPRNLAFTDGLEMGVRRHLPASGRRVSTIPAPPKAGRRP
jgi:hypothetical protein